MNDIQKTLYRKHDNALGLGMSASGPVGRPSPPEQEFYTDVYTTPC